MRSELARLLPPVELVDRPPSLWNDADGGWRPPLPLGKQSITPHCSIPQFIGQGLSVCLGFDQSASMLADLDWAMDCTVRETGQLLSPPPPSSAAVLCPVRD